VPEVAGEQRHPGGDVEALAVEVQERLDRKSMAQVVDADVLVPRPWLEASLARQLNERVANAHVQQPGADGREEERWVLRPRA